MQGATVLRSAKPFARAILHMTTFYMTSTLVQNLACQFLNKYTCHMKNFHMAPSTVANKTCHRKNFHRKLLVELRLNCGMTYEDNEDYLLHCPRFNQSRRGLFDTVARESYLVIHYLYRTIAIGHWNIVLLKATICIRLWDFFV